MCVLSVRDKTQWCVAEIQESPCQPVSCGHHAVCVCVNSPEIMLHLSKSPWVVIKLIVVQELDPEGPPQLISVCECVCFSVCVCVCVCLSIELFVAKSSFPAYSMCLFADKEINRRVNSSALCARSVEAN